MPRSLDPNARLTIVLASDSDKPKDVQPKFFAMHLNANQQRKLMAAMQVMQNAKTADEKIDATMRAAMICLIGWENMTDPATGKDIVFGPDTLGDVLDLEELAEVIAFVASAGKASSDDKKKSESLLSSDAVNSANHASENVATSSVKSGPLKSSALSATEMDATSVTEGISELSNAQVDT